MPVTRHGGWWHEPGRFVANVGMACGFHASQRHAFVTGIADLAQAVHALVGVDPDNRIIVVRGDRIARMSGDAHWLGAEFLFTPPGTGAAPAGRSVAQHRSEYGRASHHPKNYSAA